MKILKLCLANPYKVENGISKLVINRTLELEKQGHEVTVVYFRVVYIASAKIREIRRESCGTSICLEVAFTRLVFLSLWGVIGLMKRLPLQCILSELLAREFGEYISEKSRMYDVCHFYHIRTIQLWKKISNRPGLVIDLIDSYTLNYENRLRQETNLVLKLLVMFELHQIRKIERKVDSYLSRRERVILLTVAQKDNLYINSKAVPKEVVPVGIQIEEGLSKRIKESHGLKVVFFGNLDYEPNVTACKVLAKVARRLSRQDISFTVGGRNVSRRLVRQLNKDGMTVVSPVRDMRSFVEEADIAALPMMSGSGMQSKMLEAIAWKCLVIATERVASPVGLVMGKEYIRAETVDEFTDAIRRVSEKKVDTHRIKMAALQRIEKFRWSRTVKELLDIYNRLI